MKKIICSILSLFLIFSISFAVEGTNKTIKLNKLITDDLSEKGEIDYFNFSISKAGSLKITFEFDVKGGYNVNLIDVDNNKTIQTNYFSSNVNTSSGRYAKESNKVRVLKGDYQIKVSSGWNNYSDEDYELKVVYEEEKSDSYEKEPNNDARNAMVIDYNRTVTGNLQSTSDVDYYMVELPYYGEIYTTLDFDKDTGYYVEVFSENNGSLKSLQNNNYTAKLSQNSDIYSSSSQKLRVPSGNYYFKISRNWSTYLDSDYRFSVRYSANRYGNYEIEFNNEAKNANEISANTEYIGNLSSSSDNDYYKLSIYGSNKLQVKMNVPENAAYNVTTYKEINGSLSKLKTESFANKELSSLVIGSEQEISSGTYYFQITSKTYSNEDYMFMVDTNEYGYFTGKTTIVLEINNPYMLVNGVTYAIDGNRGTAPLIVNNRTLLPISAIIEKLGGTVTWTESTRSVNINLNGKNIYLTLDSAKAYVNGVETWLDVAPTSINNRTMVPVKFVMDNLGGSVIWNATTGTVTITY